jgi:hypothetical protein
MFFTKISAFPKYIEKYEVRHFIDIGCVTTSLMHCCVFEATQEFV